MILLRQRRCEAWPWKYLVFRSPSFSQDVLDLCRHKRSSFSRRKLISGFNLFNLSKLPPCISFVSASSNCWRFSASCRVTLPKCCLLHLPRPLLQSLSLFHTWNIAVPAPTLSHSACIVSSQPASVIHISSKRNGFRIYWDWLHGSSSRWRHLWSELVTLRCSSWALWNLWIQLKLATPRSRRTQVVFGGSRLLHQVIVELII